MNASLRDFKAADIYNVWRNLRGDAEHLSYVKFQELVLNYTKFGPVYTLETEGEVLGIGGVALNSYRVGICWMALTHNIVNHGLALCKLVKPFYNKLMKSLEIHRLEADIEINRETNINWAKWLGFTQESVLKCYGPNKEDFAKMVYLDGC